MESNKSCVNFIYYGIIRKILHLKSDYMPSVGTLKADIKTELN